MPHKDPIKRAEYQKDYRRKHVDKQHAYGQSYYKENKQKIRASQKEKYPEKKRIWNTNRQEKRLLNPEAACTKKQNWVNKNKVLLNEKQRKRYAEDFNYRLSLLLRNRLRKALKRNSKRGSAIRDLGCTIEQLRVWLESQFVGKMNWNNFGSYWHIDHIIPLSIFDLTDLSQLRLAVHYTNLQPLEGKENIRKGNRIF